MLFNQLRQRVEHWNGEKSLCPMCDAPLIAKKGEIKIWHWAHKANETGCESFETNWHLAWKLTYLRLPEWEIEYPIVIGRQKYRLDAFNSRTGSAREFVHSLSKFYRNKHDHLRRVGFNVTWLWDGERFKKKYARLTSNPSYFYAEDFLKPGPLFTFKVIGTYMHYNSEWWRNWQGNTWFTVESPETIYVCKQFNLIHREIREKERVLRENDDVVSESAGTGSDSGVPEETGTLESKVGLSGEIFRGSNGQTPVLPDNR